MGKAGHAQEPVIALELLGPKAQGVLAHAAQHEVVALRDVRAVLGRVPQHVVHYLEPPVLMTLLRAQALGKGHHQVRVERLLVAGNPMDVKHVLDLVGQLLGFAVEDVA